ncbi:MAG: hypothetical protein ACK5MQ_16540 [Pikeienuella sp.]
MRGPAAALLIAIAPAGLAAAPLACPADQIEAVEQVARHVESIMLEAPEQPSHIVEITHLFSGDGAKYTATSGRRLLPVDISDTGFIYAWDSYETETWETGGYIYRSLRDEKGESHKRRRRSEKDFDPNSAIEDIPANAPGAAMRAGRRCRLSHATPSPELAVTVCNLKIYGRNTPIEARSEQPDDVYQRMETTSLTRRCAAKSLFEPPARNWE